MTTDRNKIWYNSVVEHFSHSTSAHLFFNILLSKAQNSKTIICNYKKRAKCKRDHARHPLNHIKYIKSINKLSEHRSWYTPNCYSKIKVFQVITENKMISSQLGSQLSWSLERCRGIEKVIGSTHVQDWINFRPCFHLCLSSVPNCDDHSHLHFLIRSSHI